ncbi:MAG: Rpn family recombination-promoting nuclease/putative transposase [Saprospiraceae bacterium]
MSKKINNPHDKFFKAMMAEKDVAIDFLRQFLPKDVIELIDLDTISVENSSFLDDNLNEVFSDAIFKCNLKSHSDNHFYLSVLIEHKSYPDKFVVLQMLQYLVNAYQSQLKNDKILHPVIPVLFYHGKEKWEFKSLPHLFSDINPDLIKYIPDFKSVFIDLVRIDDNELLNIENVFLSSALTVQRFSDFPNELPLRVSRVIERFAIEKIRRRNFESAIIVYFYEISKFEKQEFTKFIEEIPKKLKSEFMTIYEMAIQEGIERGRKEGIEKGIEKNKLDIILKGYKKGISINDLADITGLSVVKVKEIIESDLK